jgi:hypothetical protein
MTLVTAERSCLWEIFMVILKMPGGAVEYVQGDQLLWMRKAFADERKDAVVLRIGSDRLYSIETLDELIAKFTEAKIAIAKFTPPEGRLTVAVNAGNVIEVEAGNPVIYHERARAILVFSPTVRLAVRETEAEARSLLDRATTAARPTARASSRRGARSIRRVTAVR